MEQVFYFENGTIKFQINCEINGSSLSETEIGIIRRGANDIVNKILDNSIKSNSKLLAQANEDKKKLIELFGDRSIFVEEIENEYFGGSYGEMFPWLMVTTSIGRIKIGWRKRVISINWSETIVDKTAEELFPNEDVTRGDRFIHAWGYEKAYLYLNKLLSF